MRTWMTIWFSIPLIGFGQVKSDADPLDQNEKDSSIKVTKQHDKSGNLIQYDSIYIGPGKKYRIKFAKNDFIPSPMYILPPHYGNGIEDFELFNLDTIDYVPEFNSIGDQWDMWPPDIYGQPKLDSVFGELTSKDFKKMLEMEIDILQNGSSLDSLMIRVNEHLNTMEFNMKPLPKSDNDNSFQFFSSPINNDELDSMMQKQFQKMEEYIKRLENLLREHDLSSKEEIS